MKYLLPALLLLCISCASTAYKSFSKVEVGMDKEKVLELIGSPIHVKNEGQSQIWLYRFYDENDVEIRKEVKLTKEKVVYAGVVKHPQKIINPNGSSYTHDDLEDYLKKEDKKEKSVKKPDTHDMEEEMLKDLSHDGAFVPVND